VILAIWRWKDSLGKALLTDVSLVAATKDGNNQEKPEKLDPASEHSSSGCRGRQFRTLQDEKRPAPLLKIARDALPEDHNSQTTRFPQLYVGPLAESCSWNPRILVVSGMRKLILNGIGKMTEAWWCWSASHSVPKSGA